MTYTSNTGKSQKEPPPGFEAAAAEAKGQEGEAKAEAAAPTATAVAQFDYAAVGDNQTSLTEGETVTVLEPDSGGWTGVQSSTGAGFVPSSYLAFA